MGCCFSTTGSPIRFVHCVLLIWALYLMLLLYPLSFRDSFGRCSAQLVFHGWPAPKLALRPSLRPSLRHEKASARSVGASRDNFPSNDDPSSLLLVMNCRTLASLSSMEFSHCIERFLTPSLVISHQQPTFSKSARCFATGIFKWHVSE
jgi:hypothetical protein